jgi:radical SAM protein with 4Fe4S-binding SPASM domain
MTATPDSLGQPEAIIDEYVTLGFDSIFLRWLSPYGFARRNQHSLGYRTADFLAFYRRALSYLIKLNSRGTMCREEYATLLLKKMLTPFETGYVDLQSPMGLGFKCLVYNYDGNVYASDESRMLAEMGDRRFSLGNVHRDSYEDLFVKSGLLDVAAATMTEGMPGCTDCALQPYCGTDPVFGVATRDDVVIHQPTSAFCERNMGIMKYLITLLEDDEEARRILRSWM